MNALRVPAMKSAAPTISFDDVLYDIADLLADARYWEGCGGARWASVLYALAEQKAIRSGFLELIRLVWVYAEGAHPVENGGA